MKKENLDNKDLDLGGLLFDYFTESYKANIDKNKDLINYLQEEEKKDLLFLYLMYGYAGNNGFVAEELVGLERHKKEEIIKRLIKFLDSQIYCIFQFFNEKRMSDIKEIAEQEDFFVFYKYKHNTISFDTIKVLKQLGFIFCKRDGEKIYIHMPKYIKDKINNIFGEPYLEYYDEIIKYSQGIADVYGAINLEEAYNILKRDINVSRERYENIISFVSLLELEPIYYSIKSNDLCNFNIRDDEVVQMNKITNKLRDIFVYDKQLYLDMANEQYLMEQNEYKEFRNYLKKYYDFDINDNVVLRGELIDDYIDMAQLDEKKAKETLIHNMNGTFSIDEQEKNTLINYIENIRKKMPIWKLGGKIINESRLLKVGRNDPCPCGSGKKYKNCHGKNQ